MRLQYGDLVLTNEHMYAYIDTGAWLDIPKGTFLIFLDFHINIDKIRLISSNGTISWLEGYEEGYLDIVASK